MENQQYHLAHAHAERFRIVDPYSVPIEAWVMQESLMRGKRKVVKITKGQPGSGKTTQRNLQDNRIFQAARKLVRHSHEEHPFLFPFPQQVTIHTELYDRNYHSLKRELQVEELSDEQRLLLSISFFNTKVAFVLLDLLSQKPESLKRKSRKVDILSVEYIGLPYNHAVIGAPDRCVTAFEWWAKFIHDPSSVIELINPNLRPVVRNLDQPLTDWCAFIMVDLVCEQLNLEHSIVVRNLALQAKNGQINDFREALSQEKRYLAEGISDEEAIDTILEMGPQDAILEIDAAVERDISVSYESSVAPPENRVLFTKKMAELDLPYNLRRHVAYRMLELEKLGLDSSVARVGINRFNTTAHLLPLFIK